jgi:hypothetical protein
MKNSPKSQSLDWMLTLAVAFALSGQTAPAADPDVTFAGNSAEKAPLDKDATFTPLKPAEKKHGADVRLKDELKDLSRRAAEDDASPLPDTEETDVAKKAAAREAAPR